MHGTRRLSLSVLGATVTPTGDRHPQEEVTPSCLLDMDPGGRVLGTLPQAFAPDSKAEDKCWVVIYVVCPSQNGLLKIWI